MTAIHARLTQWTGKALGAAAALIFAPASPSALVWWIVAGIAVGHLLDVTSRRLAAGAKTSADDMAAADDDGIMPAATRFAFAGLGRIGAASGSLEPEHVRVAEGLMTDLGFDADARREALIWFYAGQDDAFPFAAVGSAARPQFDARPELRGKAVDSLCRVCALVDTPAATAALLDLAAGLGIARELLALWAVAAAALTPQRSAFEDACQTLGVNADDSEAVIRLAYRRQVSRWHPDRLPADASPQQRAQADRRMWQLRDALETLLAAH